MCPPGQKCDKGQCVLDGSAPRDAGRESGPPIIMTTGGSTTVSGSATSSGTGSPPGSGAGGSGGSNQGKPGDGASCGCRLQGRRAPFEGALFVSLLALAVAWRRRAD
jgi:hypothetical protein